MTSKKSIEPVLRSHAVTACRMELDLTAIICNEAADEIGHLRHDLERVMAAETLYLNEAERLRAALTACQTYDYRTIIDDSDRYLRALETIANYSGKSEPALLLKYIAEAAINFGHETGAPQT